MCTEDTYITSVPQYMAFNPYLQTSLKHELAQGANVGDIRNANGQNFRWDGNTWTQERSSSPSYSSGGSSFGGSSVNYDDIIKKSIEAQREASKPAISSLQASMPEVQQKYATERTRLTNSKQPLQDRYSNLISSIKSQGEQDVNNQTRITNNELGKRGLVSSSTLAQQEVQNATSPLRQKYAGLEKDAGIAQEADLRAIDDQITGLTPQETADLRAIQNTIAQMESGALSAGNAQGMSLFSTLLGQETANKQLDASERLSAIDNALKQQQFDFQRQQAQSDDAFRQRQFEEQLKQQAIENARKNQSSSFNPLQYLTGGMTSNSSKPTTKPKILPQSLALMNK